MTNKFVWSGASGANDGSAWEDAYTTLMRDWGAEGSFTPGTDFVYVRSVHSESSSGTLTMTGSSGEGTTLPPRIITVVGDTTGTTPGNLATGATVTKTGTSGQININESLYLYGVDFFSGNDIVTGFSGDCDFIMEQGRLELTGVSGSDRMRFGGTSGISHRFHLIDVDVDFGQVGQLIAVDQGIFRWSGGTLHSNQTYLLGVFNHRTCVIRLEDLDLSVLTNDLTAATFFNAALDIRACRCQVGSGFGVTNGNLDTGSRIATYHCQNGTDADPAYQMEVHTERGKVVTDTARYRDDDPTDGYRSNPISWDMDTTYGSKRGYPGHPLESDPIVCLIPGDGSTAYTVRAYFASGGTQQDDDFWMDVHRANDAATNSQGVRDTKRVAPETAAANHPTDSASSWTGTDVGTKQYVEQAITPDKAGALAVRFYMTADAGSIGHIYVSPFLEVRDANGQIMTRRVWIDPTTGSQIQEFASPRAAQQLGVM